MGSPSNANTTPVLPLQLLDADESHERWNRMTTGANVKPEFTTTKPTFSFFVLISCYLYFLVKDACLFFVVFGLV